ncbi:MAG: trpE, partial [Oscillospiraceae bacterium]|nr:trpE [Oscillospiraceae bacterium]
MLYPSIQEVKDLMKEYKTVPVFYELLIDSCTPIHIFNALKETCENCFILESVDNSNQWGRYSFIGINPKMEITVKGGKVT